MVAPLAQAGDTTPRTSATAILIRATNGRFQIQNRVGHLDDSIASPFVSVKLFINPFRRESVWPLDTENGYLLHPCRRETPDQIT